jgi:hypothetical protein
LEVCKNSESNDKFLYALEEGQMRKEKFRIDYTISDTLQRAKMKGEWLDGVPPVCIAHIILVAI